MILFFLPSALPGNVVTDVRVAGENDVKSTISTNMDKWQLGTNNATLTLQTDLTTTNGMTVLASIHLLTPDRKNAQIPVEYWAPFRLESGNASSKWLRIDSASSPKQVKVNVIPANLKWAATKSSVWPSKSFTTLPTGTYRLFVEIDSEDGVKYRSNEIVVTLLPRIKKAV